MRTADHAGLDAGSDFMGTKLAPQHAMRSKRLLLVDDEENVLVGMGRYFRAAGFEVDCAREREEAQALLLHLRYDCAIIDLCLTAGQGRDGLEVVRSVRERCPAAGILVLTALASVENEREAHELGADNFFRKPRALSEIHAAVLDLLA